MAALPQATHPPPSKPTRLRLVSSTRSPLAAPRTPIHRLASALQSLLYFPDPSPLYAVVGALVANTMRGYPVWLMLIGPPESGKTELLRPLLTLPSCKECGDLSGKAALLSGTRAKDRASDATGGLLKAIEQDAQGNFRGALVMLDFARTVLAADPASARSTLGAIGMLHDRHYQRELGTDGGKTISFTGRVAFLAACTDVIDHPDHMQANAEMGERCLFCRYPVSDGYHEIDSALDNPDGIGKSAAISELFQAFSGELNFNWDEVAPPRPLEDSEKTLISALAQFTARGRSGVMRDRYNKNEVAGLSRSALGPRLANTLAQLLRGLERVGCTTQETNKVLAQCAMDSLPAARALVLDTLRDGGKQLVDVAARLRLSSSATKRTLEDLALHGLTQQETNKWHLSQKAEELLAVGWAESS